MKHSDGEATSPILVSSISSPSSNNDIVSSPVGIPTTLPSNQTPNSTAGSPPFKTPLTTRTHSNIQRPRMATFTSINNDKYSQSLREFPLNHFDRNLTVEKATFDPTLQSYIPSQQQQQQTPLNVPLGTSITSTSTIATTSTIVTNRHDSSLNDASSPVVGTPPVRSSTTPILQSSLPLIQTQQIQDDPPLSTSSSSSKILDKTATAATKRQESISQSPPRTPLSNKMKSPTMKNEGERRSTRKKKRKLPPVNGTATPSEVFHRNLVDAVSNVEDSDDEHEQYVYPYSHHDQSSTTSNKKNQHQRKRNQLPTNYRRSTAPSLSSLGTTSTLSIYHQQQKQQHQQYEQEQQQHQQQQQQQRANYGVTGIDTHRYSSSRSSGLGTRGFLNDLILNSHQHRSMPSFFKTSADESIGANNIAYSSGPTFNQSQQQQSTTSYYTHELSYDDEENGTWNKRSYHRPKLRSHVLDHPRSSASFPQPWSHEFSSSEDYDDDDDNLKQQEQRPSYRRYHHDRYDEQLYLLRHSEPQKHSYCSGLSWGSIFRNTCISVFVFMLMSLILMVYLL